MFRDTITRVRYPTTTDHGVTVPNLAGTPTTLAITGCDAQPGPPREFLDRRKASEIAWTIWAPVGTVVLPTDFVKVNGGAELAVAGEPSVWGNGSRSVDHVLIYLRASEVH